MDTFVRIRMNMNDVKILILCMLYNIKCRSQESNSYIL